MTAHVLFDGVCAIIPAMKTLKRLLGVAVVLGACVVGAGPADLVDMTYGIGYTCGNCLLGPSLPHGSIHPSPDTAPVKGHRAVASGYYPGDPVDGFSQLHAHGAGNSCPSYGLFLVRPCVGDEPFKPSPIELVSTRPYRFTARLTASDIGVDLAASEHAAIYVFTFPEGKSGRVEWDVKRKIGRAVASDDAQLTRTGNVVSGGGTYKGNWNPAPYQAFFYAEEETKGNTLTLRLAVSFRSVARAKDWFDAEVRGQTLAALAARGRHLWDERLSSVTVKGTDPETTRRFYSNLYHTFLQPRDRTGDFADWPDDTPVMDDQYTVWDTWRTLFPLMAIIDPPAVAATVNSFAARQRHNGRCEIAFIGCQDFQAGQAGDDVDNIIADAFAKDVPGLDRAGAWAVLRHHADRRTKDYRTKGWAVTTHREGYDGRFRSGTATLGFAYNDWCAAQVAEKLGKTAEAAALRARSANWTNLWDAAATDEKSGFTGFIRARDAAGKFSSTHPRKGSDFYQGSAWEYSFFVPHDIPGLIAKCGGRDRFAARLKYAFDNRLIDFGNEPSFLTPWLGCFVGNTALAADCAAKMKASFTEKGPPGDDDSGAMASLYVFISAGFFPLAGQDLYALHGTDVPELTFHLPNGRTFTVKGCPGVGFRQATLNGRVLKEPFLHHADLLAGGELVFK